MTADDSPALSIVVPAYNETHRIAGSLDRIAAFVSQGEIDAEVIVVDDGSDAEGRAALNAAVEHVPPALNARMLHHETRRGKGAAVRTGCLAARGECVAFMDADLASPPEDLTALVDALRGGADVAIGVRNQPDGSDMRDRRAPTRRLAGECFSMAVRLVLLPGVEDTQCPLKAFRAEAATRLFAEQRIESWSFDAELLYIARRLGMTVAQVPVRWTAVEGSHLRLTRAAGDLLNLLRIRWLHRNLRA